MAQTISLSIFMTLWVSLIAPSVSWGADIAQFSLAGVRLGMSPDEARRAASTYLHVEEDAFEAAPPWSDPLMGRRPLSKWMTYTSPDLELKIGFEVSNPDDKSSALVVDMVTYKTLRAEQTAKLKTLAIKEYGEPSDRTMEDGGILLWCSLPQAGKCSWGSPGASYSPEDGLMLDDPRLKAAYHEAFGRMLSRMQEEKR